MNQELFNQWCNSQINPFKMILVGYEFVAYEIFERQITKFKITPPENGPGKNQQSIYATGIVLSSLAFDDVSKAKNALKYIDNEDKFFSFANDLVNNGYTQQDIVNNVNNMIKYLYNLGTYLANIWCNLLYYGATNE